MTPQSFIAIDDDNFNNSLCKIVIRRTLGITDVTTFNKAEEALGHIVSNYKLNGSQKPTILFLDINMPTMNGWEFLEYYDKLGSEIKKNIYIFMLSSSVDPKDKKMAKDNPNVFGHLVKPFTSEMLLEVMEKFK